MTATQTSASTPTKRPARQLLAASVGNAVEWYDWYAYTFLATYIAAQVFPRSADNSLVPLLSTFAVFAVGFFMRPVGGLLMGTVADRHGRRAALTVTILLMGGTVCGHPLHVWAPSSRSRGTPGSSPGTSPSCAWCRPWCTCDCRRRPTRSYGAEVHRCATARPARSAATGSAASSSSMSTVPAPGVRDIASAQPFQSTMPVPSRAM